MNISKQTKIIYEIHVTILNAFLYLMKFNFDNDELHITQKVAFGYLTFYQQLLQTI